MKNKYRIPEFFEWTVKIKVHKKWVEDGFDLTDYRANNMIQHELPYSSALEVKARVKSRPTDSLIAKVQGYKTVKDFRNKSII